MGQPSVTVWIDWMVMSFSEQASSMETPPKARSWATVVTTGRWIKTVVSHPSITASAIVPLITGAMLSKTVMVWIIVSLTLPHASVTTYFLMMVVGQEPSTVSVCETCKSSISVHTSPNAKPIVWRDCAVVAAGSAAVSSHAFK